MKEQGKVKEDEEKMTEYRFKNKKEYRDFLDQAPHPDWLQNRSIGSGKNHKYIPIFITEGNADFIFKSWNVTSETIQPMSNGVSMVVRIEALPDYPDAREIFFTGSFGIQFKDVKNHLEFDITNCRERAIGNAFKTLGNIFGRSLNRSYKVIKDGAEKTVQIQPDFSFRNPKIKNEK